MPLILTEDQVKELLNCNFLTLRWSVGVGRGQQGDKWSDFLNTWGPLTCPSTGCSTVLHCFPLLCCTVVLHSLLHCCVTLWVAASCCPQSGRLLLFRVRQSEPKPIRSSESTPHSNLVQGVFLTIPNPPPLLIIEQKHVFRPNRCCSMQFLIFGELYLARWPVFF